MTDKNFSEWKWAPQPSGLSNCINKNSKILVCPRRETYFEGQFPAGVALEMDQATGSTNLLEADRATRSTYL